MYYVKPENGEAQFINNLHFIQVSPTSGCFIEANESSAQGVVIDGTPYSIKDIDGIERATVVPMSQWTEEIKQAYDSMICEQAKVVKIEELSQACNQAINAGAEVQLETGVEAFTYNLEDQANISDMVNAVAMGADGYLNHSNGSKCRMYNAVEIMTIYPVLATLKTHHRTYFNLLKKYVNTLTTADEVNAVTYGQDLTGDFLSRYEGLMLQAKAEIDKVLANMSKVLSSNEQ